jgi:hypothetical protein
MFRKTIMKWKYFSKRCFATLVRGKESKKERKKETNNESKADIGLYFFLNTFFLPTKLI